jgi:phosphatidylserine/phosphatidylglycerophosphate/cardiolipin synthase-like enzyme
MQPLRSLRPTRRSWAAFLAVSSCLAAAAFALGASGTPDARRPPPGPPIQLVESVPLETALGNPDLPRAADVWVALIEGARQSIDFESFYLSRWPGEALDPVLDAIGAAAKRGVRIRLLLDARMHGTYPEPADSLGRRPGIEVRTLDMRRLAGGVQHSKFFVVDGTIVYLGSQNLDWRSLAHIHELGVRVRDPRAASYFGRVFAMDWAAAGAMAAGDSTGARAAGLAAVAGPGVTWPIAIAQAPGDTARMWAGASPRGFIPGDRWDRDAIVALFDGARHEVILQALSYSIGSGDESDTTLDDALRRAAARGVRVKMMISDWQADGRRIETLQALGAVPGIEVRLSVVPEWSGGYIPFARVDHCKFLVADTLRTWIGTSNWSPDYFTRSRNVGAVFEHRGIAAAVRRTFETDWTAPGALEVGPGVTFTPRVHGEDPPPGKIKVAG